MQINTVTNMINLGDLSRTLQASVTRMPPSFVLGKTVLRDHVMNELDCSALRAEILVDRLVSEGLVGFRREHDGSLTTRPRWRFA